MHLATVLEPGWDLGERGEAGGSVLGPRGTRRVAGSRSLGAGRGEGALAPLLTPQRRRGLGLQVRTRGWQGDLGAGAEAGGEKEGAVGVRAGARRGVETAAAAPGRPGRGSARLLTWRWRRGKEREEGGGVWDSGGGVGSK